MLKRLLLYPRISWLNCKSNAYIQCHLCHSTSLQEAMFSMVSGGHSNLGLIPDSPSQKRKMAMGPPSYSSGTSPGYSGYSGGSSFPAEPAPSYTAPSYSSRPSAPAPSGTTLYSEPASTESTTDPPTAQPPG